MFDYRGWIVRSTAGHDRDTLLCVVGTDPTGQLLLLADGKRRRVGRPKRKKLGHVDMVCRGTFEHPDLRRLQDGLPVSDRAIRRALGAFRDTDQGGN